MKKSIATCLTAVLLSSVFTVFIPDNLAVPLGLESTALAAGGCTWAGECCRTQCDDDHYDDWNGCMEAPNGPERDACRDHVFASLEWCYSWCEILY